MNKKKIIYLFLIIAATAFIFRNSLKNAADSTQSSGVIVNFIVSIIKSRGYIVTEAMRGIIVHVVRKTAHITEFAMQSVALCAFFNQCKKKIKGHITDIMFIGLFTACLDEFTQLFSDGRAGMIQDVFIDFSGNILGILFFIVVISIIVHIKKNKKKNTS